MGFDSFVVFAEMRTGSNFLEEELNRIDGLTCYGEAFNPAFVGYPDRKKLKGMDLSARDEDPLRLLRHMNKRTEGMAGFRFFHDHDPRVFDAVVADASCAKIILSRPPLESYISLKIASATGQWKLTDAKHRKEARARFDADEFAAYIERLQTFRLRLVNALQTTGQTPFHIAYSDIGDLDVLNGLAAWLGVAGRLEAHTTRLKPQNPGRPIDKVSNRNDLVQALTGLDAFALTRVPELEARRIPRTPAFIAATRAPLLYFPIPGGPTDGIEDWLARLDGVARDALVRGLSEPELVAWREAAAARTMSELNYGLTHRLRLGLARRLWPDRFRDLRDRARDVRTFTVLAHPADRLHRAFQHVVLAADRATEHNKARHTLRASYEVPVPDSGEAHGWGVDQHRMAFLGFLRFVTASRLGQSGTSAEPAWVDQTAILRGISERATPDVLLREHQLAEGLKRLAAPAGLPVPAYRAMPGGKSLALATIYDDEVETAVQAAHRIDYLNFGFRRWDRTRA